MEKEFKYDKNIKKSIKKYEFKIKKMFWKIEFEINKKQKLINLSLFFLMLLGIILSKLLDSKISDLYKYETINIIIVILPMVFTVIILSLTISKDKIYGTTYSEFRKLFSNNMFSYKSMFSIIIFIFVFYCICEIFNLYLASITLNMISIIYSWFFFMQELTFISKNRDKIKKMIIQKYNYKSTNNISKNLGNNSPYVTYYNIFQNIIIQNGIISCLPYFIYNSNEEKNVY